MKANDFRWKLVLDSFSYTYDDSTYMPYFKDNTLVVYNTQYMYAMVNKNGRLLLLP